MFQLRNTRILIAISIVCFLIMFVMMIPSLITLNSLRETQKDIQEFNEHTVEQMNVFTSFKDDFHRAVISTYEYIQTGDISADIRSDMLLEAANQDLEEFARLSQDNGFEVLLANELLTVFEMQNQRVQDLKLAYEEGLGEKELFVRILNIRTTQIRSEDTIHGQIDSLIALTREEAIAQIALLYTMFLVLFGISIVLALILSGFLAFTIARLVSKSVNEAKSIAEQIAEGDLDTNVKVTSKNEFGDLMIALEHMRKSLKSMVESKDNFIALVSHQLRTPLTVVRGSTESLLHTSSKSFSDSDRSILENMHQVALRLTNMINDILSITKASAEENTTKKVSKVDLFKLTKEVCTNLAPNFANVRYHIDHQEPVRSFPKLKLNKEDIREVLTNVIENAIVYSTRNQDGELTDGDICIWYVLEPDFASINVSDNGIGIPKEEQHLIFEKFSRASNAEVKMSAGNGLGLFLAKMLIEKMSGNLSFVSSKEKGTTFTIKLPL